MAFHSACKPEAQNDPNYSIIASKYDGNICPACKGSINKGDEIAYFKKQQGTTGRLNLPPASAGNPPGGTDRDLQAKVIDLEKRIKELERLTKRMDGEVFEFTKWLTVLEGADWKKIPRTSQQAVEQPPAAIPTPEQTAKIFAGNQVDAVNATDVDAY